MRLLRTSLAVLALACAVPLAACNTSSGAPAAVATVSLDVTKAQLAARALQDVANNAIINGHASGILTGAAFNTAKADAAKANTELDKADGYIAKGQLALASPLTADALSLLATYAGAPK